MNTYSQQQLYTKFYDLTVSPGDQIKVLQVVDQIQDLVNHCEHYPKDQQQVGYLAGLMDLERPERIWFLSVLVGFETFYTGESFKGFHTLDSMPEEKRSLYPGGSSKDIRIDGGMLATLIEYYQQHGQEIYNDIYPILGLERQSVASHKRGLARKAAWEAKKQLKAVERATRLAKRMAKQKPESVGESTNPTV